MSDYISREWIKNAIHNFFRGLNHIVTEEDIQAYLDATPSADVRENIHGEWIKNFLGIDICSKCGEPMRDRRVNHINFCNCCGADMRGKANEQT